MSRPTPEPAAEQGAPLATRMRPDSLDRFYGQAHLLGEGAPLRELIDAGAVHSLVLWGPPGTGKTTLARLLASHSDAEFAALSAVTAGLKDIRDIVARAEQSRQMGKRTVLFIDEVHRFNKVQQDALLPHIEAGLFTFIGATTENPSFELNNALLSRLRVYTLKPLDEASLRQIIERARVDSEVGMGEHAVELDDDAIGQIASAANGDARAALGMLELAIGLAVAEGRAQVEPELLKRALFDNRSTFDKKGDHFYDQISALHKAVRGSSADAALYWLARMLEGGCDPLYVARRVVRMASEDIGLADPRALTVALSAWDTLLRLGSPEGELSLAQAVVYLSVAPKSNAVYTAFKAARRAAREQGSEPVPLHIRNAPTQLMKSLGHGDDYRYAHDYVEGYVAGESYLPEALSETRFYHPGEAGFEQKIARRIEQFRTLDAQSDFRRYETEE